jgi:type II secretory pathway pseudopilin PulG
MRRLTSRRRCRGLSLIETLISLSICAMLLTAAGAAFQASNDAIRMNDEFFRASQAARVSVNQVMSEVRKCQSGVVSDTSLELTTATGEKRTYDFHADTGQFTMTIDGIVPVTALMARNVSNVRFDTDGRTMSMTVTVQIGTNQIVLNGSAIPRRMLKYE